MNIAPSWKAALSMLVSALNGADDEGSEKAWQELRRMAAAADRWNAHVAEQERIQKANAVLAEARE
jgi:hypothetical protein